jgi:hypothetical protein
MSLTRWIRARTITPSEPWRSNRRYVGSDWQVWSVTVTLTGFGGTPVPSNPFLCAVRLLSARDPCGGCESVSNMGSRVATRAKQGGRLTTYNYPILTNCVVAGNRQDGISGDIPTITNCTIAAHADRGISSFGPTVTNSIAYYNGSNADGVQIESNVPPTVTLTDVQNGWPGDGNIDAVPCFVEPGHWNENGTPEDANDDFWVQGDYHLRSQAGRRDPGSQSWVLDALTSPCIDAGNPGSDWTTEPAPNGGRINMGAYGGTAEASKSLSATP